MAMRNATRLLILGTGALLTTPTGNGGQGGAAGEQVVWQIGRFDQSSQEFGHQFDTESGNFKPVFTVGQSKTEDWPAWQSTGAPGPGAHSTPYVIVFSLPKTPEGNYRLTIGVVLANPAVPDLRIEVNGRVGRYFFDRKISYYPGDGRIDSPINGGDTLNVDIPAAFLKAGENRLVLTAEADEQNSEVAASFIYDALKLTQVPTHNLAPTAVVKPTVFYRQKQGQSYEVVEVMVSSTEKLSGGEVELAVGKEHLSGALKSESDFGQERLEFEVPEFSGETPANVTIHANGKTYRTSTPIKAERKWTIYVVPHAHLDIGYADYQAKVAALQSRNIDKVLEFLPQNPAMRWSLDGSWVVQNYFATRSEEKRKEFLQYVRDGKIGVPAQYANLLTGYASLEELIRSLMYAHELHKKEGIPLDYANITDVPSVTWSYPSVLKAAGINYFAEATNSDRGPIVLEGKWNEQSPFWREGPDGAKVLMANTRQYSQLWFVCELPPQAGNCRQGLPAFLQQFSSPNYKPDAVLMFGSQLENTDARLSEPEFVEKWNAAYAYPKFVLSTFTDYFQHIEQKNGAQLATVTGDGGPYWEDGVGSDSANTAMDRNTQSRAVAAEELATMARFVNPSLAAPRQQLERIWTNLLLYAEHTWDSWDSVYRPDSRESVGQLKTKDQYAEESHEGADALAKASLSNIADRIHAPSNSLVVFNSLSWARSGLVELDLDSGTSVTDYGTNAAVPMEVLWKKTGLRHVRFLAKDVPAMGFRCYALQRSLEKEGGKAETSQSAGGTSGIVENQFYRLEVDEATGGVKSIFDKELQRELVDTSSAYRFNQYVYVEGGAGTQIVYMRKSLPLAELKVTPSSGGKIIGWRKTPFGQVLSVEALGVHTPSVKTEIFLYDDEKKIEFVDRVRKEPVREKEGVYFAFPVAAPKPSFQYEIQNGWVDPSKNMLKGAGLEWFTVGHWVKASAPDADVAIVPVDAPLVTLGDINRGTWPTEFAPKSSTIFSYLFNNYWHTNYRAEQGGETTFHYVMTSGRSLRPEELSRFGRAAMTPLETDEIVDQDKVGNPERPLEPAPASFLRLDGPGVVVENWKAAEDGHGTVLRLLETAGTESKATLRFPLLHPEKAWRCSAMEDDLQEIPVDGSSVQVSLRPHEIMTLRIVAQFERPR